MFHIVYWTISILWHLPLYVSSVMFHYYYYFINTIKPVIYLRSVLYLQNVKYGSCMLLVACFFSIYWWLGKLIFKAWQHPSLQAITALKKGAYLLKYGRRGKPKFCPFRLSNVSLIWTLQLNSVSVPSQSFGLYGVFYTFLTPSGWICTDMVLRERRETSKVEPCIQDNSWATDCKLMFLGGLDSFSRRISCLAISR